MEYEKRDGRTKMSGADVEHMDIHGNMDMQIEKGRRSNNSMRNGRSRTMSAVNTGEIEDVYEALNDRACKGIAFHEQLADYFCFLGLQGYKRMLEYQYMKECAEKRKLHKRYIDIHHKVIPVKQVQIPIFIPSDWSRYTTDDIDDNVISKFVRAALNEWHKWETETKELYEEQCAILLDLNMMADHEFIKEMIVDVEKEIKKVHRLIEQLNGTGYDATMIHTVQDKYHEKYKQKYNDRFTTKNNYRTYNEMDEPEYRERPVRRFIGY